MDEQLLHDSTIFTQTDVTTRHKVTSKDLRSIAALSWNPEFCFEGFNHQTNLECDNRWLVIRVDENSVCIELWYGHVDGRLVMDARLVGYPESQ
jgi:hypothetical protein